MTDDYPRTPSDVADDYFERAELPGDVTHIVACSDGDLAWVMDDEEPDHVLTEMREMRDHLVPENDYEYTVREVPE